MDSSLLAARAAGGDLEAFGQLYDAYFARVYDFAWRVLRDADAAAEATRRVFAGAVAALPRLGEEPRAALLLATARESLARADSSAAHSPAAALHEEAFGTFDVPDPCRLTDPSITRGDHEVACLVWEAATAIGPRDYAVLDLALRQGVAPAALAPVLQAPKGSAPTLLSRLQHEADEAIRTYVLARRGGKDCEALRGILLESGFPPYTGAVRAAVDAHVAECRTCDANRALPAAPSEILASLAPIEPPFVLKGDVWRSIVAAWPSRTEDRVAAVAPALMARSLEAGAVPAAAATAVLGDGAGSGGFDGGDGFGWYGEGDEGRRNVIWFAAAAAGMIAVAFIVGGIAVGAFGFGGGGSGGGATITRTSTPAGVETPGITPSPGVAVDTSTPAPSPSVTETPTETAIPADTPTSAPPTAHPPPTRPPSTPTRPAAGSPTPPRKPTPGGPPTPTPTPVRP